MGKTGHAERLTPHILSQRDAYEFLNQTVERCLFVNVQNNHLLVSDMFNQLVKTYDSSVYSSQRNTGKRNKTTRYQRIAGYTSACGFKTGICGNAA